MTTTAMKTTKHLATYALTLLTLTACSTGDLIDRLPDNRPDYKTSHTTNPLEIPPDLTQSSIDDSLTVAELSATDNASLSDYQNERSGQSGKTDKLAESLKNIHRSGDATWIEIEAAPSVVFNNAQSFWASNGLRLSRVDPNIGLMETAWLENKANLPASGISSILSNIIGGLTDEGVRDKFRTRIDYDGKRSFVYLTHYGATEQEITDQGKAVKDSHGQRRATSDYAWAASSRNPELEVEMLRRLNLYLLKGGKQSAATKQEKAPNKQGNMTFSQLADGTPVLVIDANFNQAWTLLGVAIDRAGYELSAQNRKGGTYTFVQVTERKVGFIVKEIERDIKTYQIGLADQGQRQIAVLRSANQQRPTQAQAQAILQKISQEIRF